MTLKNIKVTIQRCSDCVATAIFMTTLVNLLIYYCCGMRRTRKVSAWAIQIIKVFSFENITVVYLNHLLSLIWENWLETRNTNSRCSVQVRKPPPCRMVFHCLGVSTCVGVYTDKRETVYPTAIFWLLACSSSAAQVCPSTRYRSL